MFIYILTVIIIGLIFLFGFNWIRDLFSIQKDIDITKFRLDLERKFDGIRDKYDTWQGFTFRVPDGIERICFTTPHNETLVLNPNPHLCDNTHADYDFLMCDAWQDGTQNVLIDPMDALDEPVEVGPVSFSHSRDSEAVKQGYKCFPVQDSVIKLTLTGKGNSVMISDYEE